MFALTNTQLTKVIQSVIVSIDQSSLFAIISIEQLERTAPTIIRGSNNALIIVIAIAAPGGISTVVITAPGKTSRATITASAAVSGGEPHSVADSADNDGCHEEARKVYNAIFLAL